MTDTAGMVRRGPALTIDRLGRVVDVVLSILTVTMTVLMVLLVVVSVVMRYVFGAPLTYSYDLSTLVFAWIVFLGLALAEFDRAHLAVYVIDAAVPPKVLPVLLVVRQVALAFLTFAMAYIGWQLFQRAGMIMPALRISIGWLYASMPIGFLMLSIAQLLVIPRLIAAAVRAEAR